MPTSTVIISVFAVLLVVAQARSHSAPRHSINLDKKPEERWTELALQYSTEIRDLISQILSFAENFLPESVLETIKRMNLDLVNDLPYPYGAELLGIARAVNLTTAEALVSNLVYELTGFEFSSGKGIRACTSVVAQASNGTIYHMRNLDYEFMETLNKFTVEVSFMENDKVSYTGTTFVGYVGLLTGQKPHRFSVSLNQRNKGAWWMNLMQMLMSGTHGIASLLIRDILSDPFTDFKSAVNTLSSTPLIASSYIIVGGVNPGEGVVITRGRPRATDMWWLGSNHTWFLLETNYDHWEMPPRWDDRRHPGNKAMMEMGQENVTVGALWKVMSTAPVKNDGTIYSVVMCAGIPEVYSTRIWD